MSSVNIKAAAGSAGAIVAYAFATGGQAAIGSNLMYPILFSAGASAVWDMASGLQTTVTSLTNGDNRLGRAVYILGVEAVGLMVMYPALSMQERLLFGALGAGGAYLMS